MDKIQNAVWVDDETKEVCSDHYLHCSLSAIGKSKFTLTQLKELLHLTTSPSYYSTKGESVDFKALLKHKIVVPDSTPDYFVVNQLTALNPELRSAEGVKENIKQSIKVLRSYFKDLQLGKDVSKTVHPLY